MDLSLRNQGDFPTPLCRMDAKFLLRSSQVPPNLFICGVAVCWVGGLGYARGDLVSATLLTLLCRGGWSIWGMHRPLNKVIKKREIAPGEMGCESYIWCCCKMARKLKIIVAMFYLLCKKCVARVIVNT